jgi:hypothetical protein
VDRQSYHVLGWAIRWTWVYGINLFVPLYYRLPHTDWGHGLSGLWAAVWVLWAGGVVAGVAWPRFRRSIVPGGVWVALTQAVPLPHSVAESFGVTTGECVTKLFTPRAGAARDDVFMFAATLAAGQLLIALAFALGVAWNHKLDTPPNRGLRE